MKYNRVLLKLSGEALSGDKGTGFDEATCIQVAGQIKELVEDGCQVGPDRNAGNGYELFVYVRNLSLCRYEDTSVYTVCMWSLYGTFQSG